METKKFLDGEGLKTLWDEITALQSDYNETDETSPNYIKNKPFTIDVTPEEVIEEFTFTTSDTIDESTGLPTMQYVQMFGDLTIGQKMNLQFTYPELAAATGLPQYDDNGEVIFKTVRYENIEVGNFADAMGSEFLDSPAIMMGPDALIATLPESIQRVAIPNDDIVFVYSNATLANGAKTPLLITALMDWSTVEYSTYVNNCTINTFIPENVEFNADSITKQILQANWDQSNKEEVDYIKNKPFGEEILITPINEIYIKDFPLLTDDDSSIRYADFSLGLEVDKTYTVKVYDKSNSLIGIVTAVGVDAQSIVSDLPAGIKLLHASDIDEVLAADGLDFDVDGNPIYNPNKTILFDIEDDIYKSEIVGLPVNGRTYDRIKIRKIPSKYLEVDVDQEFSETSENPQSGIAVNKAILQFKNKLPSSVITSIQTLETLGDKHIRVQYNSSDTNTYPYSNSYNIYTEGIGLNSDLKTSTRGTLVAAINEVKNSTDSLNTVIWRHYDLIADNQDNIKKNTMAINDVESHKQSLCWDFPTIETDSFNEYKNSNIITNNLEKENIDIFIDSPYQYAIPLDYEVIDPYCLCVIDPQNKVIRQITEKGIEKNYYLPETAQEYLNSYTIKFVNGWSYKHATTTTGWLGNKTYNSSYSGICINILDYQGKNLLQLKKPVGSDSFGASVTAFETTINGSYYPSGKITSNYSYTVSSNSGSELGQSWTQTVRANGFTGKGFLPTDKENPGLLQWIGPDKKLYSFGQDDWTNAQVYGSFQRALNAEGIEVLGNSSNTGIDNNQHSVYCQDPDALSYVYCITSAGEVLRRSASTGFINKRWTITTDSDLFTENLQYLRTYFINNNIYAIRDKNLYVIDISTSGSAAAKLISDNFGTNHTHASLFITNDNIIKFNSLYEVSFKEIDIATLRKVNSFSTPIQSDYNQNDDTQLDYIKNRPTYEKYTDVDYTRLSSIADNPNYPIVLHSNKQYSRRLGGKIGLVEGQEYEIDWYEVSLDTSTGEMIKTFIDTCTVTATRADTALPSMYGDFTSIPASIVRLYDEDIGIEIYDGCSFQNTTITSLRVHPKASVYFTGDLLTDGYSYEYVIKNIPSQDYEIKKLDKNFVGADIDYNKLSLNPQSGIAVEQAVNQGVENAILRSKPIISNTLGDGHIQIIEDENGSPQLYTEGIGHNEDLKTFNQETIVNAINEVADNIENIKIVGKNLVSTNTNHNINLFKLSTEKCDEKTPPSVFCDYDFPPTAASGTDITLGADKILTCPVRDGIIVARIHTSAIHFYLIENNNHLTFLQTNQIPTLTGEELLSCENLRLFVIQDIESKEYIINIAVKRSDSDNYACYGFESAGSYTLSFGNIPSWIDQSLIDGFYHCQVIDSTKKYYSEIALVKLESNENNENVFNIYPFTLAPEVGSKRIDIEEMPLISVPTNYAANYGNAYNQSLMSQVSPNEKIFFNISCRTSGENKNNLITDDGQLITQCTQRICSYYDKIAALKYIGVNNSNLLLIDATTATIVQTIPIKGITLNANCTFCIENDYIYIFQGDYSYVGKINPILISLTQSSKINDFYPYDFYKLIDNKIICWNREYYSSALKCIPLYKELKFNESDNLSSIETYNQQIIKYYENTPILINNISPIEHNIKIKVTGKNLIDISKITATPDSTALNYISEVGDNYIVINTTENYSGNGVTSIGLKLKELCPQLEIGKTYTLNAESPARNQIIHCGAPATQSWSFGKNITITEDLLNAPIYFYGLSTQAEQGTGECKISNIQVYESDKPVMQYSPYVDVTSLNLTVKGKNLIDTNSAMLNYDISHGSAVGTEFNSSTAIRANNGYIVFDKINIKGGQTYTISLNNEDLWLDRMFQLDENSLITKHHSMYASNIDQAVTTITTENNTTSLVIRLRKKDGSIATIEDLQKAQLQIELNDAQTDYEPYFNETYAPDAYGNISLSYIPYICYLDINSDKVNMFVSYNKKLDGIYYDIQKLQSRNNQLQQKVETLEQIIQTNEERITLLENTVSNLVSVLSNQ